MLHLGIVGCGRVTSMFLLYAIDQVEELRVVAVADRHRERMERARRRAGAERGYASYLELVSDPEVDVAVINTPPPFHEEMVLGSLEAGKHVLCEKPLAVDVEGALSIRRASEAAGLVVLPVHNYAFTPSLDTARALVEEGSLGEVKRVSMRFENNLGGYRTETEFRLAEEAGIVQDILPHLLSVARLLAGGGWSVEGAEGRKERYPVVDNLNLNLRSRPGIELDCLLSWTKLIPSFKVDVTCAGGRIEMDLIRSPLCLGVEAGGSRRRIGPRTGLRLYLELLRFRHPSFPLQYRHLCRVVEGGEAPRIAIDDEVEIIGAVEEASRLLSETDEPLTLARHSSLREAAGL